MKVTSALVLSLALPCSEAFRVPEHIKEGVFKVEQLPDGTEKHTMLSDPIVQQGNAPSLIEQLSSSHVSRQVRPRWTYETWCGCGIDLNHGDCDAAVADLKHQLGSGKQWWGPTFAYYSIRGGVIAFACPTGWSTRAGENLIRDTLEAVTKKCGWYIAGTGKEYISNYDETQAYIGYMNTHPNQDFCKDAFASNVGYCPH